MQHLTPAQKEILIFLLTAVVVILIISFVSYVIYKECCNVTSTEEQHESEDPFDVSHMDDEERRDIPLFSNSRGRGEYQSITTRVSPSGAPPPIHSTLSPSAPSLGSFVTETSNVSAHESTPNGYEIEEHLPTYQEAVNERR